MSTDFELRPAKPGRQIRQNKQICLFLHVPVYTCINRDLAWNMIFCILVIHSYINKKLLHPIICLPFELYIPLTSKLAPFIMFTRFLYMYTLTKIFWLVFDVLHVGNTRDWLQMDRTFNIISLIVNVHVYLLIIKPCFCTCCVKEK